MTEEEKISIGERIARARKRKKINEKECSQDELAELIVKELGEESNLSAQAVSCWERGKYLPETEKLIALADVLDVSLDSLLREEHGWELKPVNFDADRMFTYVKTKAKDLKMPKTLQVLGLLRRAHKDQPRWSKYGFDTTYMVHPLTLACHALAMGIVDDNAIAVCLGHDMLEDTDIKQEELPQGEVLEAIRLVSKNLLDQNQEGWEDKYYDAIKANPLACLVKCLDRVHNLAGMADGFTYSKMVEYTQETDRYYPELLEVLKDDLKYDDAWWQLRYQMRALLETFKRML